MSDGVGAVPQVAPEADDPEAGAPEFAPPGDGATALDPLVLQAATEMAIARAKAP